MIDFLHQHNPSTHVLILGLLPRGSHTEDLFKLPSDYSRGIDAVNDQLERYAFGNKKLHFANCALPFTVGGKVMQKVATCMSDICHLPAGLLPCNSPLIHSFIVCHPLQPGTYCLE